jgi:hypothetical protein
MDVPKCCASRIREAGQRSRAAVRAADPSIRESWQRRALVHLKRNVLLRFDSVASEMLYREYLFSSLRVPRLAFSSLSVWSAFQLVFAMIDYFRPLKLTYLQRMEPAMAQRIALILFLLRIVCCSIAPTAVVVYWFRKTARVRVTPKCLCEWRRFAFQFQISLFAVVFSCSLLFLGCHVVMEDGQFDSLAYRQVFASNHSIEPLRSSWAAWTK